MHSQFISFEGIDGSGKTTYMQYVKESLEKAGHKVIVFSFPVYSSPFGMEIGNLLSGKMATNANTVDPKSMSLWYAMDRWHTLHALSFEEYDYVFFNRYTLSNIVYQSIRTGSRPEELREWIYQLEHQILSLPEPDIYFIFDLDPGMAQDNVMKKGQREYIGSEEKDVYERETDILARARLMYKTISLKGSRFEVIDVTQNGGLRNIPEIGDEVLARLKTR